MILKASIKITCEAPDNVDAWDAVRRVTTGAIMRLGELGCREIRPEITRVTANSKSVKFRPRKRS